MKLRWEQMEYTKTFDGERRSRACYLTLYIPNFDNRLSSTSSKNETIRMESSSRVIHLLGIICYLNNNNKHEKDISKNTTNVSHAFYKHCTRTKAETWKNRYQLLVDKKVCEPGQGINRRSYRRSTTYCQEMPTQSICSLHVQWQLAPENTHQCFYVITEQVQYYRWYCMRV